MSESVGLPMFFLFRDDIGRPSASLAVVQVIKRSGELLLVGARTRQLKLLSRGEIKMQLTIEVQDWMVRDIEGRTKGKFDVARAEMAVRVYYGTLCAPLYAPETWSERIKMAIYGDDNDADCPF